MGTCNRAARAGITPGMDLAQARSMLPPGLSPDSPTNALHIEEHRPDRDAAALHALACWMTRFAPTVAPDGDDALLLDVTGTDRLHGGEHRLLRAIAGALARFGFTPRVASAPTFACAWAVARFGAHDLSLVPEGRQREAIAPLPVGALRLDDATVEALAQVGVTRIEELLALKRPAIAARFDPSLLDRLDKALGRSTEVVEGVRPEPPPRAELLFDGPTDQWESIEAAARRVTQDMARVLEGLERGVRRLDVELSRPGLAPERFEIALSRPSRSVKHLWSLVRTRLERVDLGEGIEGVTLIASRTARVRHRQGTSAAMGATTGGKDGLGDDRAEETAWGELVDALLGRLGGGGVVRLETVESHLPERAWRERSVLERARRMPTGKGQSLGDRVAPADRPTILFQTPEAIDVLALTPDGPVLEVGWRGRRHRVLACAGPERIGAEWWRWGVIELGGRDGAGAPEGATEEAPDRGARASRGGRRRGPPPRPPPPPDRDYFGVCLEDGRWLWLCRQVGAGRWYAHGEWG